MCVLRYGWVHCLDGTLKVHYDRRRLIATPHRIAVATFTTNTPPSLPVVIMLQTTLGMLRGMVILDYMVAHSRSPRAFRYSRLRSCNVHHAPHADPCENCNSVVIVTTRLRIWCGDVPVPLVVLPHIVLRITAFCLHITQTLRVVAHYPPLSFAVFAFRMGQQVPTIWCWNI